MSILNSKNFFEGIVILIKIGGRIMINYIWAFLVAVSVITGILTGNIDSVTSAAFEGANSAVTTVLSFAGAVVMWCGMLKIAEKSGLTRAFTAVIRPITGILFPKLDKNSPAISAISMNMIANILGLANAATPLGLKAMTELEKLNSKKGTASDEMCMFVVLNTASIQIIPSTLIAIRASLGSQNPAEIIVPVWITSIITAFCACAVTRLYSCSDGRRL